MRRSRERGTTLMELMLVAAIITMLGLGMTQLTLTCVKWRWASDDVVRRATAEDRLRALVGKVAATARPVAGLSIGPRGELAEHALEGSIASWGFRFEALVLRASDAYWVVVAGAGARLVLHRIGFDGRVSPPEVVAEGVEDSSFLLVMGAPVPAGQERGAVGLQYKLRLRGCQERVAGFIALRTEHEVGAPPVAPTPAVRWKAGAR